MTYEELRRKVVLCRHAYHGHYISIIDDYALDLLKDQLTKWDEREPWQKASEWRDLEGFCPDNDECPRLKAAQKLQAENGWEKPEPNPIGFNLD